MNDKVISKAVIGRLPRYYRYLGDLIENNVDKISSKELSELMNVTASQIRQDLNNFGVFGQQGYGYNVKFLYEEIGKILNLNTKHNIIIVGAGNLGSAIANYTDFKRRGFDIVGIFDNNPKLIGRKVNNIEIYNFANIKKFLKENEVHIATITVPKSKASEVANILVEAGIKAIWNFAPVDLHLSQDILVENVHLTASLMQLSYNIGKDNSQK